MSKNKLLYFGVLVSVLTRTIAGPETIRDHLHPRSDHDIVIPVPRLDRGDNSPVPTRYATTAARNETSSVNCPPSIDFQMTDNRIATRVNDSGGITEVYVGDFQNNRVIRHDIEPNYVVASTSLPLGYGVPWLAVDLDKDGNFELVLQRGDPGLGGDGWIDVFSYPAWVSRGHIVFPGMKVEMHPSAINVDQDAALEVFLTASSISGAATANLIDLDSLSDTFALVASIAAPAGTGGRSAAYDFDSDGRVEFLTGNSIGYGLFEWLNSTLVYVGAVGDTGAGNHRCAVSAAPIALAGVHALIGHSYGDGGGGYRYELLKSDTDNVFTLIHLFAETTGFIGVTPCHAADVDCDGLDELVFEVGSHSDEWEYTGQFVKRCEWDFASYGTIVRWYSVDVDRNGNLEWGCVSHADVFRVFTQLECQLCDSAGVCPPEVTPICECPCAGDPQCDSVVSDIADVVRAIEIAFRGTNSIHDPQCEYSRSDVNCSGGTDVVDVVAVVNVAFRNASPGSTYCSPCPF